MMYQNTYVTQGDEMEKVGMNDAQVTVWKETITANFTAPPQLMSL
jgi:hypothetical protein